MLSALPGACWPECSDTRCRLASEPHACSAKHVAVVAFGEGKSEIVQRVLEVQSLPGALPAQLVRPSHGSLTWMLDAGSARDLKMGSWEDSKAFPRSEN